MRIAFCDHHEVTLPERHRFPMGKYAALRELLLRDGIVRPEQLVAAEPAAIDDVMAVHDAEYVQGFLGGTLERQAIQRIGFPWSQDMVMRSLASVGATLVALESAFEFGLGASLAGGTHHAHAGFGSGFCVFNDLAVAARRALDTGRARRVLVFDVDVHQGDGTAALFTGEPRVFTCSIHGARNFPARKQVSDLDVALADGTGDEAYLAALERALDEALERSQPDLVLYQGGVDVLGTDMLGRLDLSLHGVRERDRTALGRFRGEGLPVVLTLGGGYADPIEDTIAAYANTHREAAALATLDGPNRPRNRDTDGNVDVNGDVPGAPSDARAR